jgi:plasmid replication initiation protein
VTYVDSSGLIVLYLSNEVISLISRLSEQFTKYHIEQVSDFKSKYSIRLYELLIKWLNVEKLRNIVLTILDQN